MEIKKIEMSKKGQILISILLIVLFVFMIFKNVNYDLNEFKLALKAMTRQQLTLETAILGKTYNKIGEITDSSYEHKKK